MAAETASGDKTGQWPSQELVNLRASVQSADVYKSAHSGIVPGLLQVPEYALYIFRHLTPDLSDRDIADRLVNRMARQKEFYARLASEGRPETVFALSPSALAMRGVPKYVAHLQRQRLEKLMRGEEAADRLGQLTVRAFVRGQEEPGIVGREILIGPHGTSVYHEFGASGEAFYRPGDPGYETTLNALNEDLASMVDERRSLELLAASAPPQP